ncbi:MAG: proton-conducting transporter membrane subunit [Gammaproteobacteria bacterium]|nr:proton-conducting transporter membrane subunit [Gammaproteobacteria bacterium]
MTDLTLAVALPLLAAFVRPLFNAGALRWLGQLIGPVVLALVTVILFAHWSTFSEPFAIALGGFAPPLGIAFYVDRMALLFALAVPLVTLLLWPGDDGADGARRQSLTLLLAASLTGLALSGDLFNLYVFYELAAVASYGLVAGNGSSAGYVAAFRYLMISALGSVVGLLGIGLVYFKTGTLNLAELATLGNELADPQGLAAFAMLAIGFGVKAEMFPVNGWVPEVYGAASRRVAALLAGLASKLAVLVIVRILLLMFPSDEARQLLLVLGILGVVSGELAAYQARDMARMLGWSSIGQLGIVFIAFSLPGEAGLVAGVAAALHHLVVKSALFVLAGPWGGAIDRLRGAATVSALGAGLFVLFALSLLGLPPLPGFWSKFLVIGGLADAGTALHYLGMAAVLTGTVIEGAYLLRVITTLYAPPAGSPAPPRQRGSDLLTAGLFGIALLAAAVMIDPLWQTLDALAVSGVDTAAYQQTVLAAQEAHP